LRIEKTTTYGVRHPGSWLGTGNKNVAESKLNIFEWQ
jgi:hypothetical protein